MRACYAKKDPRWDCHTAYHETRRPYTKWPDRKVYTGPRGGQYVLYGKRKVYLKERQPRVIRLKKRRCKVQRGPRGGYFYMYAGEKKRIPPTTRKTIVCKK